MCQNGNFSYILKIVEKDPFLRLRMRAKEMFIGRYKSVPSFIVLAQQEHCFPEEGWNPAPSHRKPKKAQLK